MGGMQSNKEIKKQEKWNECNEIKIKSVFICIQREDCVMENQSKQTKKNLTIIETIIIIETVSFIIML